MKGVYAGYIDGLIKVGQTRNLERRMAELCFTAQASMVVFAFKRCDNDQKRRQLEVDLIWRLTGYRVVGERYLDHPAVLRALWRFGMKRVLIHKAGKTGKYYGAVTGGWSDNYDPDSKSANKDAITSRLT